MCLHSDKALVQVLWLTALERGEGSSEKEIGEGLYTDDSHVFISSLDLCSEFPELPGAWFPHLDMTKPNMTNHGLRDPPYPRKQKQANLSSVWLLSSILSHVPSCCIRNLGLILDNSSSSILHN